MDCLSKYALTKFVSMLGVIVAALLCCGSDTFAQEGVTYQTYSQTFYREEPVTETRTVYETGYESKVVTKYRPIWTNEKRDKTTVEMKPVQVTGERLERETLYRPVEETRYREIQVQEKSFEDVTEMRDEEYTVRKPVTETLYRDEKVTVVKPVTETRMETESVTAYRPVEVAQQSYVPAQLVIPSSGMAAPTGPPRMKWLQPGYYTDPQTGMSVYRRRGLHWANEPQRSASVVPVIVPQESKSVALVPETFKREKPVEVTRYVEKVETRKVPVEVERMVEETRTRKVPVTVRRPVNKTVTKKVPYTHTTYEPQEVTRRVPTVETMQKRVERVEPMDVTTCRWEPYTETVKVPKQISRKVDYKTTRKVPYTVMMRVACDGYGNRIGQPVPVKGTERIDPQWAKTRQLAASTTNRPLKEVGETSFNGLSSVLESGPAQFDISDESDRSKPNAADTTPSLRTENVELNEAAGRVETPKRVDFPETNKFSQRPTTDLAEVQRPTKTIKETVKRVPKTDFDLFLERRSRENLLRAGISPDEPKSDEPELAEPVTPDVESENKTIQETSSTIPQPLKVDVSQFPQADRPEEQADAEAQQNIDSLERDLKVERTKK